MKKHRLPSQAEFFICVFLFLLFSVPSLLFSEELYSPDEGIISVGMSEVIENDLVGARERAIEDAQKKAMVQAVASEIPSKMMEDNHRILNEKLYQQGQRFIQSFKVLSEVPQGNFYKITIRFALSQPDIKNELKKIGVTRQSQRPLRLLLMIAERDLGQRQFVFWWSSENPGSRPTLSESILKSKFQERGMYVVDHISLLKEISQKKYSRDVNLAEETVKEYGRLFDGDIVINGNVEIEMVKSEGDSGMKSVQANIAAKALQVEDGKILMVTSFHAPASSTDEVTAKGEALRKALGMLSDQMSDLISRQRKGKADGNVILLKVAGLQGFSEFLTLREEIKRRIPEIKGIYQRGISLENSQIDVETKLDAPALIQLLTSRDLESFNFHVLSSSQALIELTVSPKSLTPRPKSNP
ncbi:MAG: hypothetical protein NT096_04620 [Proteobacteria bacterium]|nr:hypothetical protein [Pseudomonadota bacterium]